MSGKSKGFTLIEVIVAVGLFAVVVAISLSFVLSGSTVFNKSADINHAARMAQYTLDWFEDNMLYASKVTLKDSTATPGASPAVSVRVVDTGADANKLLLYKTPSGPWDNLMGQGFYENLRMGIYMTQKSNRSIELKVDITNNENKKIYTASKVFTFSSNLIENGIVDQRTNKLTPYNMVVIESNIPAPAAKPPVDDPDHRYFYVTDGTNYYRVCVKNKANFMNIGDPIGTIFYDTNTKKYVVLHTWFVVGFTADVNRTLKNQAANGNFRVNGNKLQVYAGLAWRNVKTDCAM